MTPFRALPPGVSDPMPGGSGFGTTSCGPLCVAVLAEGGDVCPGCNSAGPVDAAAGGRVFGEFEPVWP